MWFKEKDEDGKTKIYFVEVSILIIMIVIGLLAALGLPKFFTKTEEVRQFAEEAKEKIKQTEATKPSKRPSIRLLIDKSDFKDQNLVQRLLEAEVIENYEYVSKYVYFDDSIKHEDQLIERLKQVGIDEINSSVAIWHKSQKVTAN